MEVKDSDFILILNLKDINGKKIRVKDCAEFTVRVWTTDRTHYLTFKRRDIISDEYTDRIAIDKKQMECLNSGVLIYDYDIAKWCDDFKHTDKKYDRVHTVITDIYWANVLNPENPCNIINYKTIEDIKDQIEELRNEHIKDLAKYKAEIDGTYIDIETKLNEEIKRSNEVDVEMFNLIKNNQSDLDNKATEISAKLDDEIKRSNEVDTELFNLIKSNGNETKEELNETNDKVDDTIKKLDNEITRATNAETVIDTKVEGEIERAKTAEGAIRDAVENERDRAIAKETLINETLSTKIDNEIERAKDREQHINDDLHNEIARAKAEEKRIEEIIIANASKDTELTEKVNTEIERAKTAEKEINDALNAEVKRATDKDAELSGLIDDLDTLIADEVKRSSDADKTLTDALNGVQNDLTSEVARAKAEEGRIESKIDTNADNLTSEIARAKQVESEITTALQTLKTTVIDNYATHKEVDNRISEVIGTAPEALDTLGEIANVLNGNGDAIEAINGVLSGKVNADEVYTKNEVDTTVNGINNTISTIKSEMAVVNGDKDTIGSIAHSLEDAKHYTDDRVAELKAEENVKLANFATKNEIAAISDTVSAHITEADGKYQPKGDYLTEHQSLEGYATEEYVDAKIDEIDLTDYALKTDIPDAYDDTEIKEQLADLTSKFDDIDVPEIDLSYYYTKEEVDGKFDDFEVPEIDTTNLATKDELNEIKSKIESVEVNVKNSDTFDDMLITDVHSAEEFVTKFNEVMANDTSNDFHTMSQDYSGLNYKAKTLVFAYQNTTPTIVINDTEITPKKITSVFEGNGYNILKVELENSEIISSISIADLGGIMRFRGSFPSNFPIVFIDNYSIDEKLIEYAKKDELPTAQTDYYANENQYIYSKYNDEKHRAITSVETYTQEAFYIPNVIDEKAEMGLDIKYWGGNYSEKIALPTATTTTPGIMSVDDKQKLDSLQNVEIPEIDLSEYAKKNELPTVQTDINGSETNYIYSNGNDNKAVISEIMMPWYDEGFSALNIGTRNWSADAWNKYEIPTATTEKNGVMSASDKQKLDSLENIDLSEYPKVSETTVIKDNNGNIITEMVIDNSDADDTIEVYTKEQCDERFAHIWVGTQAEYDALSVKNNNTIYVIQ